MLHVQICFPKPYRVVKNSLNFIHFSARVKITKRIRSFSNFRDEEYLQGDSHDQFYIVINSAIKELKRRKISPLCRDTKSRSTVLNINRIFNYPLNVNIEIPFFKSYIFTYLITKYVKILLIG